MLAGSRDINAQHFVAAALDQRLDIATTRLICVSSNLFLCDQKIYLIESWLFAELCEVARLM
jgi:hypothetical protein